jgi:hypothetical protein
VGQHNRVVVHVDDPRFGPHGLGHLVRVVRRRDAGADIQELRKAGLRGQELDGPGQEPPVGPHVVPYPGLGLEYLFGRHPVRGEVVLAA